MYGTVIAYAGVLRYCDRVCGGQTACCTEVACAGTPVCVCGTEVACAGTPVCGTERACAGARRSTQLSLIHI
eukprot:2159687-Rhodomonas_salina.1